MAEIAGLVLGGIPLALKALEKYAELYDAYHNYQESIEDLQTDLRLQDYILQGTLAIIGLYSESTIDELRECFKRKFPDKSAVLMAAVQRMGSTIAKLLEQLHVDIDAKPSALNDKIQREWYRVKHSFKVQKLERVVGQLMDRNKVIRRIVEKTEIPAEDKTLNVDKLKRNFNIHHCDSIRLRLSSLHRTIQSGLCCSCSDTHQAAIELNWENLDCNTARPFILAFSNGRNSEVFDSWRKFNITADDSPKIIDSALGSLSQFPPPRKASSASSSSHIRTVRFEPIYSPSINSCSSLGPISAASGTSWASSEITSLCSVVCPGSDSFSLLGHLNDPEVDSGRRFSLDLSHSDSPKIIEALPLKTLFLSGGQRIQRKNSYVSMSTEHRYRVAASLAWSVLHLSGSPWFCDDWDQVQMQIFLEKAPGDREMLSMYPCVSHRFSLTRIPKEQMTGISKPLDPQRTLRALGILLIELCLNRSLMEIREGILNQISASECDYSDVLRTNLDEVYSVAGHCYGDAVERCMKYMFAMNSHLRDFDVKEFRQSFYNTVVAPFQATYLDVRSAEH